MESRYGELGGTEAEDTAKEKNRGEKVKEEFNLQHQFTHFIHSFFIFHWILTTNGQIFSGLQRHCQFSCGTLNQKLFITLADLGLN